jgi:hypothetical protein
MGMKRKDKTTQPAGRPPSPWVNCQMWPAKFDARRRVNPFTRQTQTWSSGKLSAAARKRVVAYFADRGIHLSEVVDLVEGEGAVETLRLPDGGELAAELLKGIGLALGVVPSPLAAAHLLAIMKVGELLLVEGTPIEGPIPARMLALSEHDAAGVPTEAGTADVVRDASGILEALRAWKKSADEAHAARAARAKQIFRFST